MTSFALWPSDLATLELCGKPVWERTLAPVRRLGPRKVLWLGRAQGNFPERASARSMASLRDTVVLLRAELPCLTAPSLRRLVRAASNRPSALFAPAGGTPVVVAASHPHWKEALGGRALGKFDDAARRLRPSAVFAADEEELLWVRDHESWASAASVLRRRKLAALARSGVVVVDPANVHVHPEASVGAGSVLNPFVLVHGETRIGRDCTIGSFSHVVDSAIGDGTTLLDHCFVRESRIGKGAVIGPFAHLRPESNVGASARVGNFVELKKARLGDGAKAPHLSYIGDARVGRGANVGAGTITCNYDGKVKHRTVVGDFAFIGSDVQLVAPVRVGKGAYVAAGSCIVENVPPFALALARSRQVVKRGWAKRRS